MPSSLVSMAYLESRGECLMMGKLRQVSKVQGGMPLTLHQAAVVKSECVVGDWCVGVTPGGSLTAVGRPERVERDRYELSQLSVLPSPPAPALCSQPCAHLILRPGLGRFLLPFRAAPRGV